MNPSGNKGNIRIGKMCDIDAVLVTQDNGKIIVGDFTTIRYDSIVGSLEQIEIGSHCIISIAIQQIIANSRRNGTSLHGPAE